MATTSAPSAVPWPPTNTTLRSTRKRWDTHIPVPPILRPLVRAYLLGYASAVAPRLLTLLLKHVTSLMARRRALAGRPEPTPDKLQRRHDGETFFESFQQILRAGLDPRRFPAFCALLVGGSTLFEVRCPGPRSPLLSRSRHRKALTPSPDSTHHRARQPGPGRLI